MTPMPMVAIVGRPNVGKSAIFNRLAGRRVSIVHSESGVTRDRIARVVTWNDRRFELVDTGGAHLEGGASGDAIDRAVRGQVETALGDAAVAILVVDAMAGLTAGDAVAADAVRRVGRPLFVAANKCDHPGHDDAALDFARLGLPVYPVSALHNRGFDALMEPVIRVLPPQAEAPPPDDALVLVVAGRPNVGKSSYINRLLGSDRVIVTDTPGTTRDSVAIPFVLERSQTARHYLLVDTAGIRRAGKIHEPVERFSQSSAEASIRQADVVVLMLDATQGPTAQDKTIAALILKERKGCAILVNKWDLVKSTEAAYASALRRAMPFMAFCPVVFVSAASGIRIRESIETVDHVAARVRAEIPTGPLNRALSEACRRKQPPASGTKPLKLYYATQVGRAPLRIRIFVNDTRGVTQNYRVYLTGVLRSCFKLEGAPLVLQFHARR